MLLSNMFLIKVRHFSGFTGYLCFSTFYIHLNICILTFNY